MRHNSMLYGTMFGIKVADPREVVKIDTTAPVTPKPESVTYDDAGGIRTMVEWKRGPDGVASIVGVTRAALPGYDLTPAQYDIACERADASMKRHNIVSNAILANVYYEPFPSISWPFQGYHRAWGTTWEEARSKDAYPQVIDQHIRRVMAKAGDDWWHWGLNKQLPTRPLDDWTIRAARMVLAYWRAKK